MGHYEACVRLIEQGADVDLHDVEGRSPLIHALKTKQLGIVKLLLSKGCDPDKPDANGRTPLMHAAYGCSKEFVRAIIDAGGVRGARDADGRTAADYATHRKDKREAGLLIREFDLGKPNRFKFGKRNGDRNHFHHAFPEYVDYLHAKNLNVIDSLFPAFMAVLILILSHFALRNPSKVSGAVITAVVWAFEVNPLPTLYTVYLLGLLGYITLWSPIISAKTRPPVVTASLIVMSDFALHNQLGNDGAAIWALGGLLSMSVGVYGSYFAFKEAHYYETMKEFGSRRFEATRAFFFILLGIPRWAAREPVRNDEVAFTSRVYASELVIYKQTRLLSNAFRRATRQVAESLRRDHLWASQKEHQENKETARISAVWLRQVILTIFVIGTIWQIFFAWVESTQNNGTIGLVAAILSVLTLIFMLIYCKLLFRSADVVRQRLSHVQRYRNEVVAHFRNAVTSECDSKSAPNATFTLFLRSFQQDETLFVANVDFEAVLVYLIGQISEIVALDRKDDNIGAAKLRVPDEKWQEAVSDLAGKASLIVIIPHDSVGVIWEIQHLLKSKLMHKAFFIMPPVAFLRKQASGLGSPMDAERPIKLIWDNLLNNSEISSAEIPPYFPQGCIFSLNDDGSLRDWDALGMELLPWALEPLIAHGGSDGGSPNGSHPQENVNADSDQTLNTENIVLQNPFFMGEPFQGGDGGGGDGGGGSGGGGDGGGGSGGAGGG
jgi:uncharacterized membrane protein YgcG